MQKEWDEPYLWTVPVSLNYQEETDQTVFIPEDETAQNEDEISRWIKWFEAIDL